MTSLRVCTLNLWGSEAPLDRRLELAGRELARLAVDAVALQEVAPHPAGGSTAERLADALGAAVVEDDGAPGFGLAVISRGPIAAQRSCLLPSPDEGPTRRLLSVALAGGAAWLHVTHFSHGLDHGLWRERQAAAVDEAARDCDPGAVHILCGDLNAEPDTDEMRFLRGATTLFGRRTHWQDAWLRHHPDEPGHTWCAQRGEARARRSIDVDRRLDYVYVSTRQRDGRGTIESCELCPSAPGSDGAIASDHHGVVASVRVG